MEFFQLAGQLGSHRYLADEDGLLMGLCVHVSGPERRIHWASDWTELYPDVHNLQGQGLVRQVDHGPGTFGDSSLYLIEQ